MKEWQGTTAHPYHLVTPSPWPLIVALCAFSFVINITVFLKGAFFGSIIGYYSYLCLAYSTKRWWEDVITESTFEGHHTTKVELGLRLGVVLFIISEIMFFFGFFWAFFHSSISPTLEIGSVWPPKGLLLFEVKLLPLLNTILLLSSGATITWCHHSIVCGSFYKCVKSLSITILIAYFFTSFQYIEYIDTQFTISDSVFGSIFFLSTGFHGCHVLIGTNFLSRCFSRLTKSHFTTEHHVGLEAAIWYWHFVDVVWLVLFLSVYWWGT